jgi:hypothetical protein
VVRAVDRSLSVVQVEPDEYTYPGVTRTGRLWCGSVDQCAGLTGGGGKGSDIRSSAGHHQVGEPAGVGGAHAATFDA